MRRIALALVVAALASGAGTAAAGTTTQQQANDLTKQVKALQASVKKLQATVKKLEADQKDLSLGLGFVAVSQGCLAAITADALQGTWAFVDQLLVATGKPAVFGPQTAVNDYGWCALFQALALAHGITSPPPVTTFGALITVLHG